MAGTRKRPIAPRKPKQPTKARVVKPVKQRTNLTLDADAVAGGEAYSKRHGTNISQLVNRFLHGLRVVASDDAPDRIADGLSPTVRRLYGAAAGGASDVADYRAHLLKKYR